MFRFGGGLMKRLMKHGGMLVADENRLGEGGRVGGGSLESWATVKCQCGNRGWRLRRGEGNVGIREGGTGRMACDKNTCTIHSVEIILMQKMINDGHKVQKNQTWSGKSSSAFCGQKCISLVFVTVCFFFPEPTLWGLPNAKMLKIVATVWAWRPFETENDPVD